MALISKPDYTYIWASGGAVVEPSNTKKQTGWVAEVPPFQWENWAQNRQDQMLAHINQRGIVAWSGDTEYEAGGLSYVQGSDGKIYKSVAASGPATTIQDPTTDVSDTYWTVAFADVGAFLTQTAGDARYAQLANNLSDLTNVANARNNLSVYSKLESDNFGINSTRIDVASASTVNLTTSAPNTRHISITGTATINGFTVAAGQCYFVTFASTATLVNSASLVTGSGANITAATNDTCVIYATAANTVQVMYYTPAIHQALGYQQTWQNVTASRASGVTYTNTNGRPISVSVHAANQGNSVELSLTVGGIVVSNAQWTLSSGALNERRQVSAIVPAGASYSVTYSGIVSLIWVELR